MAIPITIPKYIPDAPHPKMNANNAAKRTSMTNDLKIVSISEIVPLPMDWNRLPATIPKGINNKKKHIICNASTTFGARTKLSAEYENMNDKGSANINRREQIITDEIKPIFSP